MTRRAIQVDEKVSLLIGLPLSIQHLFAMFGASVLVPAFFGLNPAIVLLMNGIGTLGYLILCKGKVPAFLGSSFAFITPVLLILGPDKSLWAANYPLALGGFVVTGVILTLMSFLIKFFGNNWLKIVFPPAVIGPIIALIGLGLAETAAKMAGIVITDKVLGYDTNAIIVSMLTFTIAILGSVLFRGFLAIIPVLVAIIIGYLSALVLGMIDFSQVAQAHFFTMPDFTIPRFNVGAIITIMPAIFVVVSEHIGHFLLTQHIIKKDIDKDPGLDRSMLGNGLFTMLAGMCGSVPNTTYGENISVMAITRVYSVWVIGGAALLSIVIAFIGKISAFIQSIPIPVMGGVSLFLFGIIAVSGIRYIVEEKVDYSKAVNLVLSSVVFIIGVSGATLTIGAIEFTKVTLATLVGLTLSVFFHILKKFNLNN